MSEGRVWRVCLLNMDLIRYRNKLRVNVWLNDFVDIPDPYDIADGWVDDVQMWPNVFNGIMGT